MSEIAWVLLGGAAWWAVGFASFIYWWTKDDDLEWRHVPLAVLAGSMGPMAFAAGWSIHGEGVGPTRPFIRRRNQEPSRPFTWRQR